MALLKLIWRQGIVADFRRQFWRQLWEFTGKTPAACTNIWKNAAWGENLFPIRESLLAKVARSGPEKMPPA